jgi:hypothetical protein
LDDALASWPTTATALAVRPRADGIAVRAPFGLDDLFALVVRANRVQVPRDVYEAKTARWRARWPRLRIMDWRDGVGRCASVTRFPH